MSKILMTQVYARVLERKAEEIEERKAAGYEAMAYDFVDFAQDMRYRDLISSIITIRSKWDSMVSDKVLEIPSACQPYSRAVLWIAPLEAAAQGRHLVRATLPETEHKNVCVRGFKYDDLCAGRGSE